MAVDTFVTEVGGRSHGQVLNANAVPLAELTQMGTRDVRARCEADSMRTQRKSFLLRQFRFQIGRAIVLPIQ